MKITYKNQLKLVLICVVTSVCISNMTAQTTWTKINTTFFNSYLGALSVYDNEVYLASAMGVHFSNDSGVNYTLLSSTLIPGSNDFVRNGQIILSAGSPAYKTSDNGVTWSKFLSSSNPTKVNKFVRDGDDIYAASDQGVYKTTFTGTGWTELNTGLTNKTIRGTDISGSKMIAVHFSGEFFVSSDKGATWTQATTVPITGSSKLAKDAVISGNNFIVGSVQGIYLSTDNGSTWTKITNGLTSVNEIFKFHKTNGKIFMATDNGVKMSVDDGQTWTTIGNDYSAKLYITSYGSHLYSTKFGEVSRMSIPGISGIDDNDLPLVNIYPNPAKSLVNIKGLNDDIKSVRIINLLGNTVYSNNAVNGSCLEINTSQYPAGVYIIRIDAKESKIIQRLIME
jgi:photosystem II stability/assembly factor-like uncharacterized protein